jgi:hypothetical protein
MPYSKLASNIQLFKKVKKDFQIKVPIFSKRNRHKKDNDHCKRLMKGPAVKM